MELELIQKHLFETILLVTQDSQDLTVFFFGIYSCVSALIAFSMTKENKERLMVAFGIFSSAFITTFIIDAMNKAEVGVSYVLLPNMFFSVSRDVTSNEEIISKVIALFVLVMFFLLNIYFISELEIKKPIRSVITALVIILVLLSATFIQSRLYLPLESIKNELSLLVCGSPAEVNQFENHIGEIIIKCGDEHVYRFDGNDIDKYGFIDLRNK